MSYSYVDRFIKTEKDQLEIAQAIFNGAKEDKDGYCACPKCGSRNISDGMLSPDDCWVSCLRCSFSLGMTNYSWMLATWNTWDRSSFQLKIIFKNLK